MWKALQAMGSANPQPRQKLVSFFGRYSETLLLVLVFFGCWGFFYATLGGPSTGDSFLYMDLSLTPRPAGEILNRWAHIYLQKLFFYFAPTPLQGAKLFWGFLVSATLIFVYLSAKWVRKDSNRFNGLAAALFFGGSALISKYPGDTLSDYTAMFFVILGVLVYLFFLRISSRYRWLMAILFGFIFFTATKSKESGFVLATLILGFGFSNNRFEIKTLLQNLLYLLIGIGLAFGTLALLDYVFINNALFSIEANSLSHYSYFVFRENNLEAGFSRRLLLIFGNLVKSVSQFGLPWIVYVFAKLSLFGILYLVTFANLINDRITERKRRVQEIFMWLMPTAFLALLILGAVAAKDRHFFPMHPILAILGAQFFVAGDKMDLRQSLSKIWGLARQPKIIVSVTLLAIYAIYKYSLGSKFQTIYFGLLVSVAEISIILMAIWIKKWTSFLSTSALLLVAVFSSYGILFSNFYPLASGQFVAESKARFQPFEAIADSFKCSPDTRIYVTAGVIKDHDLVGRATVFDVYFNCYLTNEQFTAVSDPNLPNDLLAEPYSFAYITAKQFKNLSPENQSLLLARYSLKYIEDGSVAILSEQ